MGRHEPECSGSRTSPLKCSVFDLFPLIAAHQESQGGGPKKSGEFCTFFVYFANVPVSYETTGFMVVS